MFRQWAAIAALLVVAARPQAPTRLPMEPRQAACTASVTIVQSSQYQQVASGTLMVVGTGFSGYANQQCATVSVKPNGQGTVQNGGAAIVSGTTYQNPAITAYATGYIGGTGTILLAETAKLPNAGILSLSVRTLGDLATLSLRDFGNHYTVTMDFMTGAATAILINPGTATITDMLSTGTASPALTVSASAASTAKATIQTAVGASITATASGASVSVYLGVQNNIAALTGGWLSASNGYFNTLRVDGVGATISAVSERAGTAFVSNGGTLFISGATNTLTVTSGYGSMGGIACVADVSAGSFTIGGAAAGSIQNGGTGVIQADAGRITVSDGGAATLLLGAIVTGPPLPSITLSPGPGARITQIGSAGKRDAQVTYSAAPSYTSGNQRRAVLPRQTQGLCSFGLTYCPVGVGGYSCVNLESDIFNCGGCSSSGTGVDCTTMTDGGVQCLQGVCVPDDLED